MRALCVRNREDFYDAGRLLRTVAAACFASACSAFAAELPVQPGVSKWEKVGHRRFR